MQGQSTNKRKRKRVGSGGSNAISDPKEICIQTLAPNVASIQHTSAAPCKVSLAQATSQNVAILTQGHTLEKELPLADNLDMQTERTVDTSAASRTAAGMDLLRTTIESQLSLEVLLKHEELRLIEQELAKCQIALEQLRRCTEIPYPAINLSLAVSQGDGPSLRSSSSAIPIQSPPPWGVTNGPYSRHYAKWLLPDPEFDGFGSLGHNALPPSSGKTPVRGRATRGNSTEAVTQAAGKSRLRGSVESRALPSGYAQPRDKNSPVILKRKSDGVMVKLVCLDCRRFDFNSAQGFLNHCRIAHGRNFASHEAAQDACGEPVEVDGTGTVVGMEGSNVSVANAVHPYIRAAHSFEQTPSPNSSHTAVKDLDQGLTLVQGMSNASLSARTIAPRLAQPCIPASNFASSPSTPYLSSFVRSKGMDLNLHELVSEAKSPVDNEESSAEESVGEGEDVEMADVPTADEGVPFHGRHPQMALTKQPVRTTMSPGILIGPRSRKGIDRDERRTHTFQRFKGLPIPETTSYPGGVRHGDASEPSPTHELNQAPSLVDDDDDDDEEYEAHASSSSSSFMSEDHDGRYLDFHIEDEEDGGTSKPTASVADSDCSGAIIQPSQNPVRRRMSALRSDTSTREEKHVSFMSPSPMQGTPGSRKGSERKGRRT